MELMERPHQGGPVGGLCSATDRGLRECFVGGPAVDVFVQRFRPICNRRVHEITVSERWHFDRRIVAVLSWGVPHGMRLLIGPGGVFSCSSRRCVIN